MKKVKRNIIMGLAGVLAVSSLTACALAKKENPTETKPMETNKEEVDILTKALGAKGALSKKISLKPGELLSIDSGGQRILLSEKGFIPEYDEDVAAFMSFVRGRNYLLLKDGIIEINSETTNNMLKLMKNNFSLLGALNLACNLTALPDIMKNPGDKAFHTTYDFLMDERTLVSETDNGYFFRTVCGIENYKEHKIEYTDIDGYYYNDRNELKVNVDGINITISVISGNAKLENMINKCDTYIENNQEKIKKISQDELNDIINGANNQSGSAIAPITPPFTPNPNEDLNDTIDGSVSAVGSAGSTILPR